MHPHMFHSAAAARSPSFLFPPPYTRGHPCLLCLPKAPSPDLDVVVLVSPFSMPPLLFHPCLWAVHVLVFLSSPIERKDWKRLIHSLKSKDTKVSFCLEISSLVMTDFPEEFLL